MSREGAPRLRPEPNAGAPGAGVLPAPPPRSWALPADAVLEALGSAPGTGLSAQEAARRLRRFGPNRLRQARRRSSWRILWDQFANLIVLLLAVAAGLSLGLGERVEALAIAVVILVNAAIGFTTERRALRSMEALRALGRTDAIVRREGTLRRIPAGELVPGDIVVLDAGDVPSADLRLITASRLQVDESPLTGESLPVSKSPDPVPAEAVLAERTGMLFRGSALTRGSGEGVVVATGMATELGSISALVEEAEPEATPLEERLNRLGRRLVGLTLAITLLVGVALFVSGRSPLLALQLAVALAVATVPEGLPIVATVALARGMWRMARRRALVEQLPAVETLGSTTVILTDKTGTLTENRMTVVELRLEEGSVELEGTGLEPSGRLLLDGREADPAAHPPLAEALRTAVLCNNASLAAEHGEAPTATGDPTEVALLVAGAKGGLLREPLLESWPELEELAFDPDTKRMATLHRGPEGVVAAVKGAPETVLECCARVRTGDGELPLDEEGRRVWKGRAEEMAATGKRVLALASRSVSEPADFAFEDLTLLGLAGFFDPPRERVRAAIDACQDAGIRVVMVTGDHGATAWHVGGAVGLIDPAPGDPVSFVDGRTLGSVADLPEDARAALAEAPVIARATPRQKLELIDLHQGRGEVVAMTGDGVNDAPALKKADIGVAMGQRGTQVAREAAEMVLLDDELGTIVEAVAQGRAIFSNIQKFVIYLMSCNVSEILAVGLGALAQGPLPLLPLQILFLNLVTDVFPALALGVGEGSPALMRQPPRDPDSPMLTRSHWGEILGLGAVIALCVLGALAGALFWLERPAAEATSIAFLTLALAQLWHVFSMRNRASSWLRNEVTANPWVWGAIALCVGLVLAAVYVPPLAEVLSLRDPGPAGWGLALGASLVPLAVGQVLLAVRGGGAGRPSGLPRVGT